MLYELMNPSDRYTFHAKSREAAALAVALLGSAYGARPCGGRGSADDAEVPIFIFGGMEEWYKDVFGRTMGEGLDALLADAADALGSFVLGDELDRRRYEAAMRAIGPEDKKEEFKETWQDGRSSINDIGHAAWAKTEALRQRAGGGRAKDGRAG